MFQIPKVSYHSSTDLTQVPQESVSVFHLVPRISLSRHSLMDPFLTRGWFLPSFQSSNTDILLCLHLLLWVL